jgi:hypothetical protein
MQTVCIGLLVAAIILIRRKVVTKISLNRNPETGVFLMDARHEKAIQDKMEVDE